MANRIVKTFEEFISFEIEDSEVHIHIEPKETEEMSEPEITTGDDVIVDVPLMNLSQPNSEEDMDSEDYEEDETPESDTDGEEDEE
jgi:hypothetical protein